ncbi:hypothetical protein BDW75DRAFT_207192 [Aspergillus navahoensis]
MKADLPARSCVTWFLADSTQCTSMPESNRQRIDNRQSPFISMATSSFALRWRQNQGPVPQSAFHSIQPSQSHIKRLDWLAARYSRSTSASYTLPGRLAAGTRFKWRPMLLSCLSLEDRLGIAVAQ